MTQDCNSGNLQLCRRRALLGAAMVLTPWVFPALAEDQADATSARPQPGDHLVFLTGPKKDQPARAEDLELGGEQLQAYAADPKGLVRDGSRINLVSLGRDGNNGLAEETRKGAAEGVVAYSAICTHQACPVNQWS